MIDQFNLWCVMVDDAEMGSRMEWIKKDNTRRACLRLMIAALLQEGKKEKIKKYIY